MVDVMWNKIDQLFKEVQVENYGRKETVIDIDKKKKGHDKYIIDDQNRSE